MHHESPHEAIRRQSLNVPHLTDHHPEAGQSAAIEADRAFLARSLAHHPDTESVARFVPGPGIERLNVSFDIERLREALGIALERMGERATTLTDGFGAFSLVRRPGADRETANDLSGLFHTRVDDSYAEVAREEVVDESAFTEFVPSLADTYFHEIWATLKRVAPLGRVRVLSKGLYNCNSWHRDPEPRLHLPIVSNPGSLFVVNHHVTHLPADGSVYFTDTRGYHTALNGGESHRVHLVAALPLGLGGR